MNGEISTQTITTLACSFFNKYVYNEAKLNTDYIRLYISNSNSVSTAMVSEIVNMIETKSLDDLTTPIIGMGIESSGKTEAEVNKFLGLIKEIEGYSKQQAQPFIDILRKICSHGYLKYAEKKAKGDPTAYMQLLRDYNYQSSQSDNLVVKDFSAFDPTALVAQYSAVGYRSRYDFINNTFSAGGYIPGQIVQVVGAPSCFIGSTTILVRSKANGSITTHAFEELRGGNYRNYQVLSYNIKTHEWEWSDIAFLGITKRVRELCRLDFNKEFSVFCTHDHNFLVDNGDYWKDAEDLKVDDKFVSLLPDSRLIHNPRIFEYNEDIEVWDLQTYSDNHNFCLGNGVVVHNCGKSLFMQGEAVNFVEQGKVVHYLTLGDQIKVA